MMEAERSPEYQRVREEIVRVLDNHSLPRDGYNVIPTREFNEITDQILSTRGIAVLADDQTLPEHHLSSDLSDTGLARAIAEDELLTIQETQQEMLQAGFRKVIKLEGNQE